MSTPWAWERVADDLEDAIRAGTYPPKGPLPSVRDLMAFYSVGQATIAAAVDELDQRGLIERSRGRTPTVVGVLPEQGERALSDSDWRRQIEDRLGAVEAELRRRKR